MDYGQSYPSARTNITSPACRGKRWDAFAHPKIVMVMYYKSFSKIWCETDKSCESHVVSKLDSEKSDGNIELQHPETLLTELDKLREQLKKQTRPRRAFR